MRILHVIPAVAPRYGGPSTAIWPMTSAIRELGGIEVEIATTDANGPDGRITPADLPKGGGTVHLFHRDRGETFKYSRSLQQWLHAHAREYDALQLHGHWNYPVAVASRTARHFRVPYIIRPCGMLSDYSWRKSKWKKLIYWGLQERNNVRFAAGFHVTSKEEQAEVQRLGVTAPVEIIPPGMGNEAWETPVEPNWLREQCPGAGNLPILLFLSRLHPKKGITDFLLPAFAKLSTNAYLAIAGGADDQVPGYARQVEAEVHRWGLSSRVALLGPVAPHRRWAAYDGADLFVLPSHSENFGFVVAEAMARGKAVVITKGVQFQEHAVEAKAGAVVEPNVDALASALDSLLSDPSLCARAGKSGRNYIQRNLTWRQTAEKLASLYRQVCDIQPSSEAK